MGRRVEGGVDGPSRDDEPERDATPAELEAEADDVEEPSELDVSDALAPDEPMDPVDARELSRRLSPDGADLVRLLEREKGAATVWSKRVPKERWLLSRRE